MRISLRTIAVLACGSTLLLGVLAGCRQKTDETKNSEPTPVASTAVTPSPTPTTAQPPVNKDGVTKPSQTKDPVKTVTPNEKTSTTTPVTKTGAPKPAAPTKGAALVVQGKIKAASAAPKPGSVPYKDCIIAVDLVDVKATSGKIAGSEILVFVWGMRDNKLTPAAAYKPGQTVSFTLTPWSKVEGKYGRLNRNELDDPETLSLDTYWAEGK